MHEAEEPVVVVLGRWRTGPTRVRLADVVVERSAVPGHVRCRELLDRYPGLALALVAGPAGELTAVIRDGTVVTGRVDPTGAPAPDLLLTTVARCLYARWAAGRPVGPVLCGHPGLSADTVRSPEPPGGFDPPR
ncbi:hypothetical protein [Polymorphospora rubra]|uniref:Uncharacterized protein n=1 Tax=Polymorphospora rubra TaxID=338584 RepID=A0A810N3P3_9ACTN|nr:hypothetical protein [Polymorphospora rubra]BCJ66829.1 hypothetical protein Prubr_38500 [Polymorphospora rubra]